LIIKIGVNSIFGIINIYILYFNIIKKNNILINMWLNNFNILYENSKLMLFCNRRIPRDRCIDSKIIKVKTF